LLLPLRYAVFPLARDSNRGWRRRADNSQVLFTTFNVITIVASSQWGAGRHIWDLDNVAVDLPKAIMGWYLCEPLFILANLCLKLSIGVFLTRLATTRRERWAFWAANFLNFISSMYFFFLFVFQCWPVQYFWTQYKPGVKAKPGQPATGHCIDMEVIIVSIYVYSCISCALDWAFCIYPSVLVWKLNLNLRTRVSVIAILILCAA
jgi:hypothetical protein